MKIKIFVTLLYHLKILERLEFNQYKKSDKAPLIIYADLEQLIETIDGCKKTILKTHPRQKYVNIFHQFFQSLQYCHFKA